MTNQIKGDLDLTRELQLNSDPGTAGQTLQSGGSGSLPFWTSAPVAVFTGATAGSAGTTGIAPAPAAGEQDFLLSGSGAWVPPSNPLPIYDNAADAAAGGVAVGERYALSATNTEGAVPGTVIQRLS